MTSSRGTVLVVDDDAGFRRVLRLLLAHAGWQVVGEAADGISAIAEVERLRPTLVLLDVHLPGADGIEVARQLAETHDPPTVVLTSSRGLADFGRRLAAAPVRGFVPKDELSEERLSRLLDP